MDNLCSQGLYRQKEKHIGFKENEHPGRPEGIRSPGKITAVSLFIAIPAGFLCDPAATLLIAVLIGVLAFCAYILYSNWGNAGSKNSKPASDRRRRITAAVAAYLLYSAILIAVALAFKPESLNELWRMLGPQVFILPGLIVFTYACCQWITGKDL